MRFVHLIRNMKRYFGKVFAISRILKNEHFPTPPHLNRLRQIDYIDLAITTKYIFTVLINDAQM
ncbi:hypothetical protein OZ12_19580 [Xanthomonas translucens pv. translucens]|nr:hypothetical protein OZ12_19580 [Xanthomonas translucens pv. translucens]KWV14294.1 hypothetical protein ATB54_12305 [Xanthomonas translucens]